MNCLDKAVAALLIVYNVIIITLYILFNDVNFTEVGKVTTVVTHLAAIPPLIITKSCKSLLFWMILLTTISSTLYHMAQVGWLGDELLETGWYIPSDHPLRRIDHGFSIALVFLVSVTIWYDIIPTLWIFLVTFVLMSISVAYINTVFIFPIREWISLVIIIIDFFVLWREKLDNKDKKILWLGFFVFIVSAAFYAVPTRQEWEWYSHSAWHVNVFSSIYIILRAQGEIPQFIRQPRLDTI